MRRLSAVTVGVAAVFALFASVSTAHAALVTYPSSATIRPTGPLPPGGGTTIALATVAGEQEDAIVVVSGAGRLAVSAPTRIGPLPLRLFFGHYVAFGSTYVPDALLPWDGSSRTTERANQPVWLQVTVPPGTPAGTYRDTIGVAADGRTTTVSIAVQVFAVSLPAPNQVQGNLLTAFHVAPQTYGGMVGRLFQVTRSEDLQALQPLLYSFLASYRLSPSSWGFGAPRSTAGYTRDRRWWLSSEENVVLQVGGRAFAAMSIPISNNRTSPRNYIADLSPFAPERWCSYLQSVRTFWQERGWLDSFPYLYGMDEPGLAGFRMVAKQAAMLHRCFPGANVLVTGNPSQTNRFLWNGGQDDVDVWVVLGNRYYGAYTVPKLQRRNISRARDKLKLVDAVRSRGKHVWTYTYRNTRTPGLTATEPLSNSRMLFLWSALENVRGVLYGEGTTNYTGDPFSAVAQRGEFVLLYPGRYTPIPSARLEQIRDGIEDWALYEIVRGRSGAGAVRRILGDAGLFSASAAGVKLGCTIGCELKTSTPFAWPVWSHDGSTAARIERAKLQALRFAAR
jgi:hypothetical protein